MMATMKKHLHQFNTRFDSALAQFTQIHRFFGIPDNLCWNASCHTGRCLYQRGFYYPAVCLVLWTAVIKIGVLNAPLMLL